MGEASTGMGLRESHQSQQGARRGVALLLLDTFALLLISHGNIGLCHVASQGIVQQRLEASSFPDIGTHKLVIEGLETKAQDIRVFHEFQAIFVLLLETAVHLGHVLRQLLVLVTIHGVQQQEDHVEAGQQRSGQVNVLHRRLVGIVAAVDWVCCSQNGGPAVQGGRDPALGDGHRLLLHDLVDGCPVAFLHLVKLIDAANAVVSQDQGATLQGHLSGGVVPVHRGRQAHAGGALARGVDGPRSDGADLLQQLTLGHTRVAHHQGMNVAADLQAILHLLGEGTNEHQQQGLLHVLVSEDLRSDRLGGVLIEAAVRHGFVELVLHGVLIRWALAVALLVLLNVMCLDVHGLSGRCVLPHRHVVGQLMGVVHASQSDGISRQHFSCQVSLHQD
mmetsp:Transcript_3534/g.5879  ORF Transcript_3534/g.5879 Transcript_3534/m.5879 type:complete len:391 (+) Transcript_3534:371-1543(+)